MRVKLQDYLTLASLTKRNIASLIPVSTALLMLSVSLCLTLPCSSNPSSKCFTTTPVHKTRGMKCCCSQDKLQPELQIKPERNRRWRLSFKKFAGLTTASDRDASASDIPFLFICPVIFHCITFSTYSDQFRTTLKLIHRLFNPCLSGLHCCSPVQQTCWARLLQAAVLPKDKNPMQKTVAFLYQRCFAKQVKEDMQKHHKTCTPPAKGDAMEHMQDRASTFL